MLYRDDDINVYADLTTLLKIQNMFDQYRKVHTVTVILENIWESRGVWEWLMTTPNIEIGLHGWRHLDYSLESKSTFEMDLRCALNYWEMCVKRGGYKFRPLNVFYPPWNKSNEGIVQTCEFFGLKVDARPTGKDVYNFHWWECFQGDGMKKLQEELNGVTITEESLLHGTNV